MKHVLFCGFSVMSGNTYRETSKHVCSSFRISAFAIGGLHYFYLYPWIRSLIASRRPDWVILDLASTPCRSWVKRDNFTSHVHALIDLLRFHGVGVAFCNFYRHDVDEATDIVLDELRKISAARSAPSLDFYDVFRTHPDVDPRVILWDGVHGSSTDGAAFLSRQIIQFADSLVKSDIVIESIPSVKSDILMNSTDMCSEPRTVSMFSRNGAECPVIEIPAAATCRLHVPNGYSIATLYVVSGPRSGKLSICSGDGHLQDVQAFDRHSYYERLKVADLHLPGKTRWIDIAQSPDLPDVALDKGSLNAEPRIGKIATVSLKRI